MKIVFAVGANTSCQSLCAYILPDSFLSTYARIPMHRVSTDTVSNNAL